MKTLHEIPPHGHVRYVDHLGCDQTIVQAARVSYLSPSKGEEADKKLLFYLYKNRHTSPFEQCSITFNIKMPVFIMRQFVRHRTFRLNEVSGRYTELPDEMFMPHAWRKQSTVNKQSSEPSNYIDHPLCNSIAEHAYTVAYKCYKELLSQGVAKEQARFVLPVATYTEIVVNADVRNLMHFFSLRIDPHAQEEFRAVAIAMFAIFHSLFP